MSDASATVNGQANVAEKPAQETSKRGGLVKSKKATSTLAILDVNTNAQLVPTDSLPNHRPIAVSTLKVVNTLPGNRPIMQDTLEIVNTDLLPGHRPIMASLLHSVTLDVLPGGRPIGPNEVDPDSYTLMGYLD